MWCFPTLWISNAESKITVKIIKPESKINNLHNTCKQMCKWLTKQGKWINEHQEISTWTAVISIWGTWKVEDGDNSSNCLVMVSEVWTLLLTLAEENMLARTTCNHRKMLFNSLCNLGYLTVVISQKFYHLFWDCNMEKKKDRWKTFIETCYISKLLCMEM